MHALILKLTRVRDADAIVDFLTDTDRVIHAYARNFRNNRKFPNSLELFSVYEIEVSQGNLDKLWLNSAYSEQVFTELVKEVTCFAAASAILETVDVAHAEDTPMPNIFRTILQAFAAMEAAPELAVLIHAWVEARILYVQQILPNLKLCSGCGKVLEKSAYFQQEQGFLCEPCTHGQENVAACVFSAIRRLLTVSMQDVLISAVRVNDTEKRRAVLHETTKLLAHCLRDSSTRRALNAHVCLGETAFEDHEFLGAPAQ